MHPFRFRSFIVAILMVLCSFGTVQPAFALATDWQKAEFSKARLVVGNLIPASETNETIQLQTALDVQLNDGWKTYWRSAGDAGFPLTVEVLPESRNVKAARVQWPHPKRFVEEWGLEVFGYKKQVAFPIDIELKDAAVETEILLQVTYAVCSDICISEEQRIALVIPAGAKADSSHAAQVDAARADVPVSNTKGGLTIHQPEIRAENDKTGVLAIRVKSEAGSVAADTDVFVEGPVGLRFPKGKTERGASSNEKIFVIPYEISLPAKSLKNQPITATWVNGGQSVEAAFDAVIDTPQSAPSDAPEAEQVASESDSMLGSMILLALLGGLILNVMPCVLPVLSLKLMGVAKHGGGDQREVRLSFAMTVLGIVTFFVGLALLTIITKHAGEAVGWGLHFQSTPFLTFLSGLIFLVAANLLGIFEIALPQCLNTRIYETGRGGKERHRHLLGDFATGLFAALMATPCTAPFLGTAVGFALARGDSEILIIFIALGVGLALPYLLAAAFPSVATRLPKPGIWMVRIKQFMGVLMLAAALWLISVLVDQAGSGLAALVLTVTVAVGIVLHGRSRWLPLQRRGRVPLLLAGLMLVLYFASTIPPSEQSLVAQRARVSGQIDWQKFDESAIANHVAKGNIVFVDVTAEWCLTCKANKLFSLSDADVVKALTRKDVVVMQGDLTKPDAVIETFLRKHNRYGIPFNIIYSPAHPEGQVLPELLTPAIVLEAIETARKS